MNKLFKSLICLALILSTLFALASCGKKPTLDFDKAEDNLDDADYEIYRFEGDDDEIFGLAMILGNSSLLHGVKEALFATEDDNVIIIIEFEDSKSASLYYDSLKLNHEMEKAELEHEIKSAELELKTLKHVLKQYEDDIDDDDIEDQIDDIEDEIEDLKEELKNIDKEQLFGKSGKKVWAATEDAIDDANGK